MISEQTAVGQPHVNFYAEKIVYTRKWIFFHENHRPNLLLGHVRILIAFIIINQKFLSVSLSPSVQCVFDSTRFFCVLPKFYYLISVAGEKNLSRMGIA